VIPDTHSADYLKYLTAYVSREPADIVLHMGDMVDQALDKEYHEVKEILTGFDQAMMTMPGNHETFQGDLDLYQLYFGSPTYHLVYGDALIIILNSAYNESIHQSDATQFHYLERLLQENKQKHIIIA